MLKEQLRLHEIEVTTTFDPDLPRIVGEPNQLEQVWINLFSNARDAFDVTESPVEKHFLISSKVDASQKNVVISFQDNGPGMSPEVRKKALEPFYTTKEVGKGMGLGLSISYGIISNHKGDITIESKENEGTIILVTLPIGAHDE
jgi:two-component system NtrC family sensor kinase